MSASTARAKIFASISQNLASDISDPNRRKRVMDRLRTHARNTVPSRVPQQAEARMDEFQKFCLENAMSWVEVTTLADIPVQVHAFLRDHQQPTQIKGTLEDIVSSIPWDINPLLSLTYGACTAKDVTTISGCVAAIAETGTLVVQSGRLFSIGAAFFPDNHIVIIKQSQVQAWYEQGWDIVREMSPTGIPRHVTLISGPSRTADIEHKVQLGAHGPRRLHIIMLKHA